MSTLPSRQSARSSLTEAFHWGRALAARPYGVLRGNRMGEIGGVILAVLLLLTVFGPTIAPHDPQAKQLNDDNTVRSLEGPSTTNPLGTTRYGRDVLSQLLVGARTALLVGFLTATIVVTIGTSVGLTAGYYGGYVDDILMRITDIVYGIPVLPFAIVVLTVLDRSILLIILMLGLIYWRNCARIVRSEAISLREEEFIESAETTGASSLRIIYRQLLPNMLPLSFLYFAFATGWAIVTAASVAFLGFGDPSRISWGRMMFAAWNTNSVLAQPFWIAAPGLMIMLTVSSVYMIGQTYEEVANPRLQEGS